MDNVYTPEPEPPLPPPHGPMTPFGLAIEAIALERQYQNKKHGIDGHSIGSWLLILEFELNEAKQAAIRPSFGRDNVIAEIIQIAAVAVAALEQHGVEELNGRQV